MSVLGAVIFMSRRCDVARRHPASIIEQIGSVQGRFKIGICWVLLPPIGNLERDYIKSSTCLYLMLTIQLLTNGGSIQGIR